MRMKSKLPFLVGMVCLCASTILAARSDAVDNGTYTTSDKEFYLSTEQIYFIRPGLNIEIIDVVIPDDLQLEVTYSLKDPGDLPLDMMVYIHPARWICGIC